MEQSNDATARDALDLKRAFRREFDKLMDLAADRYRQGIQYGKPDSELTLQYVDDVMEAIRRASGSSSFLGADQAKEQSEAFVRHSFEQLDNPNAEQYDWAFAVPVRTKRDEAMDNSSELTPFLPILDSKFGVPADVRQRAIANLAPSVLDTYIGDGSTRGAVVFTPLFEDMKTDLGHLSAGEKFRLQSDIMQQTSEFVHRKLGASVMGLGALLPSLTHFGSDIRETGLLTTTGHAGTVYLLNEIVRRELETSASATIGVVGAAGSIGRAAADYILEEIPEAAVVAYDTNRNGLIRYAMNHYEWQLGRAGVAASLRETLQDSNIIVAAVTQPIDLDIEDPDRSLDLSGKVIIDDSQPGSFDRQQVQERGGTLRWVVGHDNSEGSMLHRVNSYNFGDRVGLRNPGDVWGCEAEVGAVALAGARNLVVHDRVTTDNVRAIGELIQEVGIGLADAQSYGELVA